MLRFLLCAIATIGITLPLSAEALPDDIKALLDKELVTAQAVAKDAAIVAAVKNYNAAPPSTMTNDAWKKLTVLSPEVKALIKSDIGQLLKSKKTPQITEIFLNGADGGKVAFLSKTTSWTHKGKPKHDLPMTGKTWYGEVEVDESSGTQQVQVSIPVLDGSTPVGSLVIGYGIAQMKDNAAK